jgi:hypothetical protein
VPATQLVVPCAFIQLTPQLPQACVLSLSVASQPFCVSPSQSPDIPVIQLGRHTPCAQAVAPCVVLHCRSQLPQLSTSSVVEVSQPFPITPSQSA